MSDDDIHLVVLVTCAFAAGFCLAAILFGVAP